MGAPVTRTTPVVYGNAAYGSGENLASLEQMGATAMTKGATGSRARRAVLQERFAVDLDARTVTCPGEHTVALRGDADGVRQARFATLCTTCPLRAGCTTSGSGRTINVGQRRPARAAARRRACPLGRSRIAGRLPRQPAKVERRLAHLVRRRHGGRRAQVGGLPHVIQDWDLNAAARNLARPAALGLRHSRAGWRTATA